jgi:hypothetical protein
MYFEIVVEPEFDMSGMKNHTVEFDLHGIDYDVFFIADSYSFEVSDSSDLITGGIEEWNFSTCERTTCSFVPDVSGIGVLYYEVFVSGAACRSYAEIAGNVGEIAG